MLAYGPPQAWKPTFTPDPSSVLLLGILQHSGLLGLLGLLGLFVIGYIQL